MEVHNIDSKRNSRVLREFLEKNNFKVITKNLGTEWALLYATNNNYEKL